MKGERDIGPPAESHRPNSSRQTYSFIGLQVPTSPYNDTLGSGRVKKERSGRRK